jgi:hypothetical protein
MPFALYHFVYDKSDKVNASLGLSYVLLTPITDKNHRLF